MKTELQAIERTQGKLIQNIEKLEDVLRDSLENFSQNFNKARINKVTDSIDRNLTEIGKNLSYLATESKKVQDNPQAIVEVQQAINGFKNNIQNSLETINDLQNEISEKIKELKEQLNNMTGDEKKILADEIQQLIQVKYQINQYIADIESLQQEFKTEPELLSRLKSIETSSTLSLEAKAKAIDATVSSVRSEQLSAKTLAEYKMLNNQYTEAMVNTIANISQELFRAVPESEFTDPGKAPAPGSARGNLTAFSDQLSQFILRSIFETTNITERTLAMERAAQMAIQLKQKGDLYSYMTIQAVLNNAAILKLPITKKGLSPEATALIETQPGGKFRSELYAIYRNRVKEGKPAVPPLSSYLGDLVVLAELQDNNPDESKRKLTDSVKAVELLGELKKGQDISAPMAAINNDRNLESELKASLTNNQKLITSENLKVQESKVESKYQELEAKKLREIADKVNANKDIKDADKPTLIAKKQADFKANATAEKKRILDVLITDFISMKNEAHATRMENPDRLNADKYSNPLKSSNIVSHLGFVQPALQFDMPLTGSYSNQSQRATTVAVSQPIEAVNIPLTNSHPVNPAADSPPPIPPIPEGGFPPLPPKVSMPIEEKNLDTNVDAAPVSDAVDAVPNVNAVDAAPIADTTNIGPPPNTPPPLPPDAAPNDDTKIDVMPAADAVDAAQNVNTVDAAPIADTTNIGPPPNTPPPLPPDAAPNNTADAAPDEKADAAPTANASDLPPPPNVPPPPPPIEASEDAKINAVADNTSVETRPRANAVSGKDAAANAVDTTNDSRLRAASIGSDEKKQPEQADNASTNALHSSTMPNPQNGVFFNTAAISEIAKNQSNELYKSNKVMVEVLQFVYRAARFVGNLTKSEKNAAVQNKQAIDAIEQKQNDFKIDKVKSYFSVQIFADLLGEQRTKAIKEAVNAIVDKAASLKKSIIVLGGEPEAKQELTNTANKKGVPNHMQGNDEKPIFNPDDDKENVTSNIRVKK